jgi:hypothetical protein
VSFAALNDALAGRKRILLAGAGGGYDVLGAVPLLMDLLASSDREVHLASLSFTYLSGLAGAIQQKRFPNLYEVPASAATGDAYCPEAWLARWLEATLGRQQRIWAFEKTGAKPLARAYRHLVERFELDAIVLIDGGIDSILRGDENSLGTPSEDLASLSAVHQLDVPTRLIACVGLGAELRDGICHEQVFDRIAELTRAGGYLGAEALVPGRPAADRYREAVQYVFENQQHQRRSHIHKVVLQAMHGEFGSTAPDVWLSPLLSLYWFFSLPVVANTHLFLDSVRDTEAIWDVSARIEGARKVIGVRSRTGIPI